MGLLGHGKSTLALILPESVHPEGCFPEYHELAAAFVVIFGVSIFETWIEMYNLTTMLGRPGERK